MKERHTIISPLVCIFLIFCCQFSIIDSVSAQVVPDSYRQQKQQEYQNFRDSIHDDFVRYLEQLWQEYQLFTGEPSPRNIKPVEQPVLDTADSISDTLKTDRQIPYGELTQEIPVDETKIMIPSDAGAFAKRNYTVTFYGRRLDIAVSKSLSDLALSGIRERQVARFWKRLDECYAEQCVAILDRHRRDLYLGDWGLFDLVRHISATIFPGHPNEQNILSVFLMDVMHYDVRIGRADNRLVMLVRTGSRLYDTPYVEIDSIRYYAFGDAPVKGHIHTYDRQLEGAVHKLDMHLAYSPRLGGALAAHSFTATFSGRRVAFRVNQPLMEFYSHYPQTELCVYATAAIEEALAAAIEREIRPLIEGHTPVGALNTLLEFMQQGFRYQTDKKQFGREKNFFCEENFYYHANDCEDRAVLFARIVQMLLGYDVVLLEYPDHVATAVNIPGRKVRGHHIDIKGQRYMVCDPTSIGAGVGDLSRKYRNKKANVLLTK